MNEKQYVQYKNDPNGTKWEVLYEDATDYQVHGNNAWRWFPKSEYAPCPPPERWVDVTAEVEYQDAAKWSHLKHNGHDVLHGQYRMRKVQLFTSVDGQEVAGEQWAFIVEKREE